MGAILSVAHAAKPLFLAPAGSTGAQRAAPTERGAGHRWLTGAATSMASSVQLPRPPWLSFVRRLAAWPVSWQRPCFDHSFFRPHDEGISLFLFVVCDRSRTFVAACPLPVSCDSRVVIRNTVLLLYTMADNFGAMACDSKKRGRRKSEAGGCCDQWRIASRRLEE